MARSQASPKTAPQTGSHRPERMLDEPPVAPGTRDARPHEEGDLQLPHERDQSVGADSTGGMGTGAAGRQQRDTLKQASQDLRQGQVDTDMRATPGLDAERRKRLVDDPKGAPAPRGSVAGDKKPGRH